MSRLKPLAVLTLDLDDQWSYMKIHGDNGWELYPSYLHIFIPYILNILDELDLKITFFIVGRDAALENNKDILQKIVSKGHEVGNHSFHHETWLREYSPEQLEEEIELAEEAIAEATGVRPIGFRGPGFSWSTDLIEILQKRGYLFDASILPTYIGPLARLYYFWKSKLSTEERKRRKELFGSFKDGLQPIKPFFWNIQDNNSSLLEIPVTTMPVFKLPFHLSYLIYISSFSKLLMKVYLKFSILLCRLTKTSPSFLLHPLDLISSEQIPQLAFFPGMHIKSENKIAAFKYTITTLKRYYNLTTINSYAQYVQDRKQKFKHINLR
jgi:peptidoglycan-N-acetylglucosamine deacetylase